MFKKVNAPDFLYKSPEIALPPSCIMRCPGIPVPHTVYLQTQLPHPTNDRMRTRQECYPVFFRTLPLSFFSSDAHPDSFLPCINLPGPTSGTTSMRTTAYFFLRKNYPKRGESPQNDRVTFLSGAHLTKNAPRSPLSPRPLTQTLHIITQQITKSALSPNISTKPLARAYTRENT